MGKGDKMKKLIIMTIVFLLLAGTAIAANVSFRWDANTETDLAGYRLYQTETSGVYIYGDGNQVATIPAGTEEVTLADVTDGQHYWVLTAYDMSGNESGRSNEVSTIIDSVPPAPPGGLSIWEIIIAFIKRILSWFA